MKETKLQLIKNSIDQYLTYAQQRELINYMVSEMVEELKEWVEK